MKKFIFTVYITVFFCCFLGKAQSTNNGIVGQTAPLTTNPTNNSQFEVRSKVLSHNLLANPTGSFITGSLSSNSYDPITNPLRWSSLGNYTNTDYGLKMISGNKFLNFGYLNDQQSILWGKKFATVGDAVPDLLFQSIKFSGTNGNYSSGTNRFIMSGDAANNPAPFASYADKGLIGSRADGTFGDILNADAQWAAMGRVDVPSNSQTLFGLRLQRAGRGLALGYTGAAQLGGLPTIGNAFLEWIGSSGQGVTPGNLEFKFGTNSLNPASSVSVFKMEPTSATTGNSYAQNGFLGHLQQGSIGNVALGNTWITNGLFTPSIGPSIYGSRIQRNGYALNTNIREDQNGFIKSYIEYGGNAGVAGQSNFNLTFRPFTTDNDFNNSKTALQLLPNANAIFGNTASGLYTNPKVEINTNNDQLGLAVNTNNSIAIRANSFNTRTAVFTGDGDNTVDFVEGVVGEARGSNGYNFGVYGYAEDATVGSSGFKNNYGVGGKGQFGGLAIGVSGDSEAGNIGTWGLYGRALNPGSSWGLAGYFEGDAYATGNFWSASDKNLKKEIKPLQNSLEKIMQLNPVSYYFDTQKYKDNQLSKILQNGLIAQEVEKIFPELVIDSKLPIRNEKDMIIGLRDSKAMNYIGLISILTKAIQELNTKVETLESKLQQQTTYVVNESKVSKSTLMELETKAFSLSQNVPNPFSVSTTINYEVTSTTKQALLAIFDLNGKMIAQYNLQQGKNKQLTIQGNTLQPGMYFYTLIADGIEVITKKMILTK